jgi:hypothetical protein
VRNPGRTSEMFFSRRRDCAEAAANAASVPTLTSRGFVAALARRLVSTAVALAVRFAGADVPVVDFLAAAFDGRLARTGRSVMARTSLSSASPDPKPRGSGMDVVDQRQ